MTPLWTLVLAVVGGVALGVAVHELWHRARLRRSGAETLPADVPHVVDLLRRAHDALGATIVLPGGETLMSADTPALPESLVDRAVAAARLALGDGRTHVLREGNIIVAVGDGQLGGALLLGFDQPDQQDVDAAASDLRRLLAEVRVERTRRLHVRRDPGSLPDWLVTGAESLEGMTFALCEAVRMQTGHAAAVVMRDPGTLLATVVAVSQGLDRRLLGRAVTAGSAVGRACVGDIPVVGASGPELFGHTAPDRRRRHEGGTAFPLRDGRQGVGALVVFGAHGALLPEAREKVLAYTADAGAHLAAAAHVRAAENRAMTDALTGLANRRALERVMGEWSDGTCALVCVDLDHFKRLNDGFGHAAGDEALRHVARILRQSLRGDDLAARIGGEEFALWLPGAPLAKAREVAERVRGAVEQGVLQWSGADIRLTCSLGLAGVPDTVTRPQNLLAAADTALYRAKSLGRNRVETAQRRVELET